MDRWVATTYAQQWANKLDANAFYAVLSITSVALFDFCFRHSGGLVRFCLVMFLNEHLRMNTISNCAAFHDQMVCSTECELIWFCASVIASTQLERVVIVHCLHNVPPSPLIDNIQVMVVVWRLREDIIRTAPCWVVWHNVHSQQHTYMSSSYRFSRLGLSPLCCL